MSRVEHAGGDWEHADARVRPVALFLIALALVSAAVMAGARWMSVALERSAARRDAALHPMAGTDAPPPGPRLQKNPSAELEAYRASQALWTEQYGWIDRQAGVVRVPIERAMELVLEEGLPARKP